MANSMGIPILYAGGAVLAGSYFGDRCYILITSIITGMISCNQTLTIMLTHQLCDDLEKDPEQMAVHLENTAVVVAPLIPWSIAGTVVLTAVEAPMGCILTAWYLYLIPVWNLAAALYKRKRAEGVKA